MPERDAILIPGGGVREAGALPSWVRTRLDRAVELYSGEYIVTLSAGTTHRPPPLDPRGFPIFESVAAAKYLIAAGIPPQRILTETHSYDTIGNAFFSRVIHADPQDFRRLLVITSDFHLPRTRAIFEWIYGLDPQSPRCQLEFESVADPSMRPDALADRQQREAQSLDAFKTIAPQITTLETCHRWLFTEHSAYNATSAAFREPDLDPGTLRTY